MKTQVFALSVLFLVCSCSKPTQPPPTVRTIELSVEDASCTETWLRIQITDASPPPFVISLTRDHQTLRTLQLSTRDTLFVDEGLLQNRTYTYKAFRLDNTQLVDSSTHVIVTTLDSTSHSFSFRIDTLGVISSVLSDVAIISENDIWVVGELYLNDSSGNLDPNPYNVAHWNGVNWEAIRIYSDCRLYWPNCGPVYFTVSRGKAAFAFGPNDVWIVAGGVHHFDGTRWVEQQAMVEIGGTNKIWGSSSTNLWFVGNGGRLIQKSGNTWRQVESGTTLAVQDIIGDGPLSSGQQQVLAVASNKFTNNGVAVLGISSAAVVSYQVSGLPTTSLVGIWGTVGRKYYVCGDGVFETYDLRSPWRAVPGIPMIFTEGIRGNALNDVIVVGDFGLVLHWNGVDWHQYTGAELPFFPGQFESVDVTEDLVVAVGWFNDGRAVVLRGRK